MKRSLKTLLIASVAILLSLQSFAQGKSVLIGDITNKIQIGNLAGSRPLTFGFRNMLEEYLQENNFDIVEDETKFDYKVNIDLLFFDVETTKSSVAVFHKNNAETVLKIKASSSAEVIVTKYPCWPLNVVVNAADLAPV